MFPDFQEETIDVRPDEQFDEDRLADYLRGKLVGADQPMQVRQFGGGAANLTYLLRFGELEYVLRRPPLGPVAPSAHDMGREYKVLSVLHQAFPYAPRAYLFCDDVNIVGAPFFIIERRVGTVVRRSIPAHYAHIPDAPRQMSIALIDTLSEFHHVDYKAIGLGDLGKPDGFVERQVDGWFRRWHKAKEHDLDEMDKLNRWLKDHLPKVTQSSLVHNDYKLDNTMLANDNPGKMVAVFDWDMCTLGDPLVDLGALLTYWTEPTDPPLMQMTTSMPTGVSEFMTRQELVERYAKQSGRDVTNIRFYHTLGLYRLVVIIAQIYIRFVRGQTKDQRFAVMGDMIPALAKSAWMVVNGEF